MTDGLTGLAALNITESDLSDQVSEVSDIVARIAAARKVRGLTGAQLGELTGLSKDQVSEIESGRRRVDVSELPRFASALGVTVLELIGQTERPV